MVEPCLTDNKEIGVFEPQAMQAMRTAFEEICREMNVPRSAREARRAIATRVIAHAYRGECDAGQLRDQVLKSLRPDGPHI